VPYPFRQKTLPESKCGSERSLLESVAFPRDQGMGRLLEEAEKEEEEGEEEEEEGKKLPRHRASTDPSPGGCRLRAGPERAATAAGGRRGLGASAEKIVEAIAAER